MRRPLQLGKDITFNTQRYEEECSRSLGSVRGTRLSSAVMRRTLQLGKDITFNTQRYEEECSRSLGSVRGTRLSSAVMRRTLQLGKDITFNTQRYGSTEQPVSYFDHSMWNITRQHDCRRLFTQRTCRNKSSPEINAFSALHDLRTHFKQAYRPSMQVKQLRCHVPINWLNSVNMKSH